MNLAFYSSKKVLTVEAINKGDILLEDWTANVLFLDFTNEFSSYHIFHLAQLSLIRFEGCFRSLDFHEEFWFIHKGRPLSIEHAFTDLI